MERPPVLDRGLGIAFFLDQEPGKCLVRVGASWVKLQRAPQFSLRPLVVAILGKQNTQVAPESGVARFERARLPHLRDGLVQKLRVAQCQGEIAVQARVIGPQAQCMAEQRNGRCSVALRAQQHPQIAQRFDVFGVELEGLAESRRRFLDMTLVEEAKTFRVQPQSRVRGGLLGREETNEE